MFKKIEIWILYLTLLFSILFTIGFGALVRHEMSGGQGLKNIGLGWVSETALFFAEIPTNLKRILISDLILEDRFSSIDGFDGSPNSKESYLLLSRYDHDLKEEVVELVDLRSFEILHTWNPDVKTINNLVEQTDEFKHLGTGIIHPKLLQDGGLLFKDDTPLRKIDYCSNLVFQNTKDRFHHSIETDIDSNVWIPSRIYPQSLPIKKVGRNIKEEDGYVDDSIVKLSADGEILFEKSVSQIFIDNGLEYLLFGHGATYEKDPIHLNDIQPVDFDGDYWKKGDVFLSPRAQSMVLLYRPSTNKIIWKGVGSFFRQHDVNILDNTRISIFNNNFKSFASGHQVDGNNEVIIYDFATDEYSSYLKDSLVKNDVRTITQGRGHILLNGDLYIEETDYGRTLYFNSDGSLRWTHVNRGSDGNIYRVGWSRILYTQEDIKIVANFLKNKLACN
tara:strand:+ start:1207 stop:2550 length:1344 start_codon:yes stop_codon:yes gene_type:complete